MASREFDARYMCVYVRDHSQSRNSNRNAIQPYILRVSNYKLQKQQRKRGKKSTHRQSFQLLIAIFNARCNILFIECARCLLYVRLSNFILFFFISLNVFYSLSWALAFCVLVHAYDCDPLSSDLIGSRRASQPAS